MRKVIDVDKAYEVLTDYYHHKTEIQHIGLREALERVPSVQPEPAIPLQWIEAQIEWLKSLDNAFSALTAGQISAMVKKWKEEQDGNQS